MVEKLKSFMAAMPATKCFHLATHLAARLGQFTKTLKMRVQINPNSSRPHAITYTNTNFQFSFFSFSLFICQKNIHLQHIHTDIQYITKMLFKD